MPEGQDDGRFSVTTPRARDLSSCIESRIVVREAMLQPNSLRGRYTRTPGEKAMGTPPREAKTVARRGCFAVRFSFSLRPRTNDSANDWERKNRERERRQTVERVCRGGRANSKLTCHPLPHASAGEPHFAHFAQVGEWQSNKANAMEKGHAPMRA